MIYTMADLLEFLGLDIFNYVDNREENCEKLEREKESIEKHELFGKTRMDHAGSGNRSPEDLNPFSEYLVQKVFADLGPGILSFGDYESGDPTPVEIPLVVEWGGENLPKYQLLKDEIDQLLGQQRLQPFGELEFSALFAVNRCQVDIVRLRQSITQGMPFEERADLVLGLTSRWLSS